MINKSLDITKYLVHRFAFDGDLVTNLKMQKILYFVYVWNLVKRGDHVFDEKLAGFVSAHQHKYPKGFWKSSLTVETAACKR